MLPTDDQVPELCGIAGCTGVAIGRIPLKTGDLPICDRHRQILESLVAMKGTEGKH